MTSFSSAVAIDRPEALTDYDRAVFGAGAGAGDGAAAPPSAPATCSAGTDFKPGEAHLDGHRYLMGDGFMLNEEEGTDGSVRTRRVAVMHSRNCLDNRSIIGKLPGVFEALVVAIRSGRICVRPACVQAYTGSVRNQSVASPCANNDYALFQVQFSREPVPGMPSGVASHLSQQRQQEGPW